MRRRWRGWRWLPLLMVGGALAGCALLKPLPRQSNLDQRLAMLPTKGLPLDQPVIVRWDEHQIPFIEAATDDDAAFALGLVHAHLRLGQMAVYRRIAQGRVAEMGGLLGRDIDRGIRILDFARASEASLATMPEVTRRWLQRFVDGVNHYQATMPTPPHEYAVLGLQREPWTPADVLTFGRLAGTDVNWLVWFNLLKLRQRADWPQIWARMVHEGGDRTTAAASPGQQESAVESLLSGLSRSGSNSLAIAPPRTRGGAAIMANDPHLGINLPNTWLIAGLKSPSYDVVGLMVPGLPLFAIGRNRQIAWGGTNMRAAVSDLIDAGSLPEDERTTRRERIAVRWWTDAEIDVRETTFGPILSDAPQLADLALPDLALHWTGHQPSDEVTAMLAVARSRSFDEFRRSFASFAVPGQNMLYADANGTIGKVFAVMIPDRSDIPADLVVEPEESQRAWRGLRDARELPVIVDPPEGFLASANNRPQVEGADVGWFFSPDDRVQRMAELLDRAGRVDVAQVKAMQRDVYVRSSDALNRLLISRLRETGVAGNAAGAARRVYEMMAAWDGEYRMEEQQPVAFELFRYFFTQEFYQALFGASDWAAFAGVGAIKTLLIEDVEARPAATLAPLLAESLDRAGQKLADFPTWGDMHRLQLRHPLAFLPVIGDRYAFVDEPIGGSTDSLMKTAHAATNERHRASYGANARHVSDLGDPDGNWFVLLGGQDGWLNSSTFLDQVPLWLQGQYVQMPLRPETVRARFPFVTELRP